MITNLSADDKQFDFIKNKKILCWKIKHRGFFFYRHGKIMNYSNSKKNGPIIFLIQPGVNN